MPFEATFYAFMLTKLYRAGKPNKTQQIFTVNSFTFNGGNV